MRGSIAETVGDVTESGEATGKNTEYRRQNTGDRIQEQNTAHGIQNDPGG